MADIPVATLDEMQDTLARAQMAVMGFKERERQLREREAKIPALEAEIQQKVDRIVSLDKSHRDLESKVADLQLEHQRQTEALEALRTARVTEESQLNVIRQEFATFQQKFARA